jgi:hypothetical protein
MAILVFGEFAFNEWDGDLLFGSSFQFGFHLGRYPAKL